MSPTPLPVLLQSPQPWLKLALSLTPSSLPVSKAGREKPILPLLFLRVPGSEEPCDLSSPLLHGVWGPWEQAGMGQGGHEDWRVSGRTGSVEGAQGGDSEEGIWQGDR